MAKDYVVVTGNGEVETIEEVRVRTNEIKETTVTDVVSMNWMDIQIAGAQEQVTFYQEEVVRLQAERALVEVEAAKVALKKGEGKT